MYNCPICNQKIEDLDTLQIHVKNCIASQKAKQNERLRQMNDSLNRLKAAEKYFKEQLDKFASEYPEEYKINFPQYTNATVQQNADNKSEDRTKKDKKHQTSSCEHCNDDCFCDFDCESDIIRAYDKAWTELKKDPFVQSMMKYLGIV